MEHGFEGVEGVGEAAASARRLFGQHGDELVSGVAVEGLQPLPGVTGGGVEGRATQEGAGCAPRPLQERRVAPAKGGGDVGAGGPGPHFGGGERGDAHLKPPGT